MTDVPLMCKCIPFRFNNILIFPNRPSAIDRSEVMSSSVNATVLLYSKCHLSLLERLRLHLMKVLIRPELTADYLLSRLAKCITGDAEVGFSEGLVLAIFIAKLLNEHA